MFAHLQSIIVLASSFDFKWLQDMNHYFMIGILAVAYIFMIKLITLSMILLFYSIISMVASRSSCTKIVKIVHSSCTTVIKILRLPR